MNPELKIPEYVSEYCEGYKVKYAGEYENYKVYSVSFKPEKGYEDAPSMTGYPCYILWDPKYPDELKQVSDIHFKITDALEANKK